MRSDWKKPTCVMTAALLLSAACAAGGAPLPVFSPIGDLPGSSIVSAGVAISNDGITVVGSSKAVATGDEPAYWTPTSGLVGLGFRGVAANTSASAVSADGSVIAGNYLYQGQYDEFGQIITFNAGRAFYWTQATGYVDLPNNEVFTQDTRVNAMSDDGLTLIGSYVYANTGQSNAGMWTAATQWVPLAGYPYPALDADGDARTEAFGCSPDASIVTGRWSDPDGPELFPGFFLPITSAFRWTQAGGMELLGNLPSSQATETGRAVSADGATIVGSTANKAQPFRWTAAGGPIGMGLLPDCNVGEAMSVSGDGSIIVGYCNSPNNAIKGVAFIWDAQNGMRRLKDVLVAAGVTGLENWKLRTANDISPDGRYISGTGENPDGRTEGFRIDLGAQEPSCAADFNGDHIRDVADLFGYINAWLVKAANADFNHDSTVDVADLFGYINAWLAGC